MMMKNVMGILFAAILSGGGGYAPASAQAALLVERWCGPALKGPHRDALHVEKKGGRVILRFDLAALPERAKVYHAYLYIEKRGGQPDEPIVVRPLQKGGSGTAKPARKRLPLEPPWYRRYPVSEWVRKGSQGSKEQEGRRGVAFAVPPFEGFLPERSFLEIAYEGKAATLPPQVEGLRAIHHDGQTFLVWREHPAYRPELEEVKYVKRFKGFLKDETAPGPSKDSVGRPYHPAITLRTLRRLQGFALRDKPINNPPQEIRPLRRIRDVPEVRYRVYRHDRPITAGNIHQARFLGEVRPLSGLDTEMYYIHFKGEYHEQWEDPDVLLPALCVEDARPLNMSEALYCHHVTKDGKAYYAVTCLVDGVENAKVFSAQNSLQEAVLEKTGLPVPVFQFQDRGPARWFRYWAVPGREYNLPNHSFRVLVGEPPGYKAPGPMVIKAFSWHFNIRGSMIAHLAKDAITLQPENPIPWVPLLFFNAGRQTLRAKRECRVDYFLERYLSRLTKWAIAKHRVDVAQIAGGTLGFGLRHPELFTHLSMGTYTATYDSLWAPGSPAFLGPKGIRTVADEDAWAMFSLTGYVRRYPQREIPFLICISGTGKDRGHTSEFGWQDDPRGWAALQEARQPFVAFWSGEHGFPLPRYLARLRWRGPIPAFSNCSLDNNPGNGDPADGDYYGQINGWLCWDEAQSEDTADVLALTIFIIPECPVDVCTVDLTPRHIHHFKLKPGQTVRWENRAVKGNRLLQHGTAAADRWGRITLKNVRVDTGKNRVLIRKQ